MLLGLLTVWNTTVLGYEGYAVLPYCQALTRFVAHIQQLDMVSNGKRVKMDGSVCTNSTGAIYFGEPGTNGQHSFAPVVVMIQWSTRPPSVQVFPWHARIAAEWLW